MIAYMEGYQALSQLAAQWGRSQATLRQQIAKGVLVAEKVGRDWLVTDAEAARYAREHLGKRGVGSALHPLHGVGRQKHIPDLANESQTSNDPTRRSGRDDTQ